MSSLLQSPFSSTKWSSYPSVYRIANTLKCRIGNAMLVLLPAVKKEKSLKEQHDWREMTKTGVHLMDSLRFASTLMLTNLTTAHILCS